MIDLHLVNHVQLPPIHLPRPAVLIAWICGPLFSAQLLLLALLLVA